MRALRMDSEVRCDRSSGRTVSQRFRRLRGLPLEPFSGPDALAVGDRSFRCRRLLTQDRIDDLGRGVNGGVPPQDRAPDDRGLVHARRFEQGRSSTIAVAATRTPGPATT